ncbi:MAG: AAA family ATPase [Candidatus Pacebacteria bacterium]|nr:AAA family ATPase [Candidatus Paceibacterota bacterium]MBP9772687.1 AAA family ATPase [Candidatus Paceibacterota bacterium]
MKKQRIYKIALTGGPCSGKTTVLSVLHSKLTSLGYRVLIAHETATILINSRLIPGSIKFQEYVLDFMLHYEDMIEQYAKDTGAEKVVILYDRGAIEGLAYVNRREQRAYEQMIQSKGHSAVGLRDARYEAVIHMVTAADGALDFYSTLSNEARYETPRQARYRDKRLKESWTGHAHLRIVNNKNKTFKGKVNEVVKLVFNFLGIPVPIEDERKFLIDRKFKMSNIPVHYQKVNIIQHYLLTERGISERVRRKGQGGFFAFYNTIKIPILNSKSAKEEIERIVEQNEYNTLLIRQDPKCWPVVKDRACYIWDDQYLEHDFFDQSLKRFPKDSLLELELTEKNQKIIIPSFVEPYVIREVTGEEEYSNANLARKN